MVGSREAKQQEEAEGYILQRMDKTTRGSGGLHLAADGQNNKRKRRATSCSGWTKQQEEAEGYILQRMDKTTEEAEGYILQRMDKTTRGSGGLHLAADGQKKKKRRATSCSGWTKEEEAQGYISQRMDKTTRGSGGLHLVADGQNPVGTVAW